MYSIGNNAGWAARQNKHPRMVSDPKKFISRADVDIQIRIRHKNKMASISCDKYAKLVESAKGVACVEFVRRENALRTQLASLKDFASEEREERVKRSTSKSRLWKKFELEQLLRASRLVESEERSLLLGRQKQRVKNQYLSLAAVINSQVFRENYMLPGAMRNPPGTGPQTPLAVRGVRSKPAPQPDKKDGEKANGFVENTTEEDSEVSALKRRKETTRQDLHLPAIAALNTQHSQRTSTILSGGNSNGDSRTAGLRGAHGGQSPTKTIFSRNLSRDITQLELLEEKHRMDSVRNAEKLAKLEEETGLKLPPTINIKAVRTPLGSAKVPVIAHLKRSHTELHNFVIPDQWVISEAERERPAELRKTAVVAACDTGSRRSYSPLEDSFPRRKSKPELRMKPGTSPSDGRGLRDSLEMQRQRMAEALLPNNPTLAPMLTIQEE